jgi:mono/diheme cytochrome c family protein
MSDSSKPDLEESVNVTAAHEKILSGAAAARRENVEQEGGAQPIALWAFVVLILAGIPVGMSLGKVTGLFSYESNVAPGYVRVVPAGDSDAGPPPKTAVEAYAAKGQKVFGKCIGCHGADGKGDGANYPSLADSAFVHGETERFAMIILNGLTGPTSYGKVYGVMPSQAAGMSAEDLAAVMTYVRNTFGEKKGDVITKQMAAAALEISAKRKNAGAPVTAEELNTEHNKNLPGDVLDPTTLLDPVSLAPAEAK